MSEFTNKILHQLNGEKIFLDEENWSERIFLIGNTLNSNQTSNSTWCENSFIKFWYWWNCFISYVQFFFEHFRSSSFFLFNFFSEITKESDVSISSNCLFSSHVFGPCLSTSMDIEACCGAYLCSALFSFEKKRELSSSAARYDIAKGQYLTLSKLINEKILEKFLTILAFN